MRTCTATEASCVITFACKWPGSWFRQPVLYHWTERNEPRSLSLGTGDAAQGRIEVAVGEAARWVLQERDVVRATIAEDLAHGAFCDTSEYNHSVPFMTKYVLLQPSGAGGTRRFAGWFVTSAGSSASWVTLDGVGDAVVRACPSKTIDRFANASGGGMWRLADRRSSATPLVNAGRLQDQQHPTVVSFHRQRRTRRLVVGAASSIGAVRARFTVGLRHSSCSVSVARNAFADFHRSAHYATAEHVERHGKVHDVGAPPATHGPQVPGQFLRLPIVKAACSHGVKGPYRRSTLENRSISSSRTRVLESSP